MTAVRTSSEPSLTSGARAIFERMAQYRDELEAARHRVDTLKAQLDERDASLRARDAELTEQRAENERLRKGGAPPARARSTLMVVALVLVTVIGAIGYVYGDAMSRRAALEAEIARERAAAARERDEGLAAQARAEEAARAEQAARAAASAPETPPPPAAPPYEPSGTATLNLNSIPVSNVVIDGRPFGRTPQVGVAVTAGTHEVTFLHPELGKKSVVVEVKAGETRTAAVKLK